MLRKFIKLGKKINVEVNWFTRAIREKMCIIFGLSPPKKFTLFAWLMKNAFYFILKALCILKIFKFLSWLFGLVEKNCLIGDIRLIVKFMTSQNGQQTIAIHILFPNISRIQGNQTLKLDHLIKYNKRNIFLQKLCRKWGRDTSSRPFIFLWMLKMR